MSERPAHLENTNNLITWTRPSDHSNLSYLFYPSSLLRTTLHVYSAYTARFPQPLSTEEWSDFYTDPGILDTFPLGQAAGKSSKCYLSSNSPLWSGHHCINNSPWGWVSESSTNLCKEPGTHSFLHHNHSQSWAEKRKRQKTALRVFQEKICWSSRSLNSQLSLY